MEDERYWAKDMFCSIYEREAWTVAHSLVWRTWGKRLTDEEYIRNAVMLRFLWKTYFLYANHNEAAYESALTIYDDIREGRQRADGRSLDSLIKTTKGILSICRKRNDPFQTFLFNVLSEVDDTEDFVHGLVKMRNRLVRIRREHELTQSSEIINKRRLRLSISSRSDQT